MRIYKEKFSDVFWRLYCKPAGYRHRDLDAVMNRGIHKGRFGYWWECWNGTYCNAHSSEECFRTQKECLDNLAAFLVERENKTA